MTRMGAAVTSSDLYTLSIGRFCSRTCTIESFLFSNWQVKLKRKHQSYYTSGRPLTHQPNGTYSFLKGEGSVQSIVGGAYGVYQKLFNQLLRWKKWKGTEEDKNTFKVSPKSLSWAVALSSRTPINASNVACN